MLRRAHRPFVQAVRVLAVAAVAAVAAVGSLAAVDGASSAGAPDFLDVVQVGSGAAALTSVATQVSIVPLLSSGVTGTPIALPTAASGANKPFTVSGTATSEGSLALSGDRSYLTLAGYSAVPGTAGVASTASAAVPRVVARVSAAGSVDTSSTISDAFSVNSVRGAVSVDGSAFWVSGAGASAGLVRQTLGSTGGSTQIVTASTNARVPRIFGGNLFYSTGSGTAGIYQVNATGTPPLTNPGAPTLVAAATSPYGFAIVSLGGVTADTLYVADGTAIRKFNLVAGSWVAAGTSTPAVNALAHLAASAASGVAQLYLTTLDGSKVLAFSDASGSGAAITGTFTTVATAPSNTTYKGIAFAPAGQVRPGPAPTVSPADVGLTAALGDVANPAITATVATTDTAYSAADLTLAATSSNPAAVAGGGISVTGTGATRTITLTPAGAVGTATVTLTATDPGGRTGSASFTYAVSAAAPTATTRYLDGASDASTAIDVGGGYLVVGDDESNVLRLYRGSASGLPVKTWDFQATIGTTEIDIEAAARSGNTIWWTGSGGNTSSGNVRPSEWLLFATMISGSGAATELTLAGAYSTLRPELVAWDQANGHGLGANALGLAASTAPGQTSKQVDGYAIEGLEFAPDGTTAYLGFRAPLVLPGGRTKALVVPVSNLRALTSTGGSASFGAPILWDLGGQSVRDIRRGAAGEYLVIAGSWNAGGSFEVWTWDGVAADAPVATLTALPSGAGSWEGIVAVPAPLTSGATVQFVEDNGSVDLYANGSAARDLPLALRKARLDTAAIVLPTQAVAFTSAPPVAVRAGTTVAVAATGGASRTAITFSVGGASGAGVCSVSGTVVSLLAPGTCVVAADQGGTFQYQPAPTAAQAFTVLPPAPQPVTITSVPPVPAWAGDSYRLLASGGGSGRPLAFSIAPAAAGVCALRADGVTVDFVAAGSCTAEADQAGGNGWATGHAEQSFAIQAIPAGTPDTTLTTTPPAATSRTAPFTWSATLPGSLFECSFDGGAFAPCSSPRTYHGLSLGLHTFAVRAVRNGLRDPLPAGWTWTIVPPSVPPVTVLLATPGLVTPSRQAGFVWAADQVGARFECRLAAAAWAACSSPRTYNGLPLGAHTLQVRATGVTGRVEALPASTSWTIVP